MKRGFIRISILTFIFSLILISNSFSQALYCYKIYTDKFPEMRMEWMGRGADGDSLKAPWTQFAIEENGTEIPITIDDSRKATPEAAVLLLIDCSASMFEKADQQSNARKIDWAKDGANYFIDSLNFTGNTQVACVFFGNGNRQQTDHIFGFSKNEVKIKDALNYQQDIPGVTDFQKAFLGPSYNVFDMFDQTPIDIQRHIIFVSDGEPGQNFNFDIQDAIVAKAREKKVLIHSLSIISQADDGIKNICFATGGKQVFGNEKFYLRSQFQGLASIIQRPWLNHFVWKAPYSCTEPGRNRQIEVKRTTTAGTKVIHQAQYVAPDYSVNSVTLSNANLIFGPTGSGNETKKITVSHVGDKFMFKGIEFDKANQFEVKNWGGQAPPFEFKNGDKREITIGYPETPPTISNKVTMTMLIEDYPCTIPTVELVSVCNGKITGQLALDDTPKNLSTTKDITCGFKNMTAVPIEIDVLIGGDNASEFSLTKGGGKQLLGIGPQGCLDISVKFSPKSEGAKSAYIEYIMPDDCGGTYRTQLTGNGIINSIDDNYIGSGSGIFRISAVPNPADDNINIRFEIDKPSNVKMELVNTLGTVVEVLLDKQIDKGAYESSYSVAGLNPGVYFIRIIESNRSDIYKLIVNK